MHSFSRPIRRGGGGGRGRRGATIVCRLYPGRRAQGSRRDVDRSKWSTEDILEGSEEIRESQKRIRIRFNHNEDHVVGNMTDMWLGPDGWMWSSGYVNDPEIAEKILNKTFTGVSLSYEADAGTFANKEIKEFSICPPNGQDFDDARIVMCHNNDKKEEISWTIQNEVEFFDSRILKKHNRQMESDFGGQDPAAASSPSISSLTEIPGVFQHPSKQGHFLVSTLSNLDDVGRAADSLGIDRQFLIRHEFSKATNPEMLRALGNLSEDQLRIQMQQLIAANEFRDGEIALERKQQQEKQTLQEEAQRRKNLEAASSTASSLVNFFTQGKAADESTKQNLEKQWQQKFANADPEICAVMNNLLNQNKRSAGDRAFDQAVGGRSLKAHSRTVGSSSMDESGESFFSKFCRGFDSAQQQQQQQQRTLQEHSRGGSSRGSETSVATQSGFDMSSMIANTCSQAMGTFYESDVPDAHEMGRIVMSHSKEANKLADEIREKEADPFKRVRMMHMKRARSAMEQLVACEGPERVAGVFSDPRVMAFANQLYEHKMMNELSQTNNETGSWFGTEDITSMRQKGQSTSHVDPIMFDEKVMGTLKVVPFDDYARQAALITPVHP